MSDLDAFGYRPATNTIAGFTIGAAEGKNEETLEPIVILTIRFAVDPEGEALELTIPRDDDVEPVDGVAATVPVSIPIPLGTASAFLENLARVVQVARDEML